MFQEMWLGLKRYWALSWWWKAPTLALAFIVALILIGAITGDGNDTDDSVVAEQTSGPTASPPDERTTVATAAPTSEPTPQPTPEPTPQPTPEATPSGPAMTFGDGTFVVSQDILPGVYRSEGDGNDVLCYWERLRGFGGDFGEIIANGTGAGQIVRIDETDAGFSSNNCGTWSLGLQPVTNSPTDAFGNGTFAVGIDITPGTWSADGGDLCYWERLSGFGHAGVDEIIANDASGGNAIVTIASSDVGFTSQRCGTWTLQP